MGNPNDCDPCQTGEGPPPTLCDGNTTNNCWVENGICLLDSMSKEQIVYTIEHNPLARTDLAKVTTCEDILELLKDIPILPAVQEDDAQQKAFNSADCLPFYTIFRGSFNDR